jgi:small subunit ribosomal protein S17
MTDVEQGTVRGDRKLRTGRVISDKMDKTVVVQVANRRSHPLYKKVMQRRENFKAHDETNECRIGDLVRIMETRPISKDKRWRVVEVVEKAR